MAAMMAVMTAMALMKMKMRMKAVGMLVVEMVVVGVVVVKIAGLKMATSLAAEAALVVLFMVRLVQSMACLVALAVTIRMTP